MSIRLRLALWYTAVLTGTIIVLGLILYFVIAQHTLAEEDDRIISRAQHLAASVMADSSGAIDPQRLVSMEISSFETQDIYVQVLDKDGKLIARSENLGQQALPVEAQALQEAQNGDGFLYSSRTGSHFARVYIKRLGSDSQPAGFVEIGSSYEGVNETLSQLRLTLLATGLFSIVLAASVGWAAAGGALKPVATITRAAQAIALSRGFSRRVPETDSKDELGQLGATFNQMLASLEEAYAAQQRFVADASHELRAPLTSVRANLELLERKGDALPSEERKALVGAATRETNRMVRLVTDLLYLARADAGQTMRPRLIEVDRLLLEVYGEAVLLSKGIKIAIAKIDQIQMLADGDLLKQLFLILLDNATRYTPVGGKVRLSLYRNGGSAILEVADTGIGIAPEDLDHVFERFYRSDRARARDGGGTGLGLAIGKWIVEQHGGSIRVESEPGHGSVFTVELPL